MLVEELHFVRAAVKNSADNELYHTLCFFDDIGQLCECDLRLYVPELGNVTGCVRLLCSE